MDDKNIASPNDIGLRITRSDGVVCLAWNERGLRQVMTVDEETAHVVDNRGWAVTPSDARLIEMFLRDVDMSALGRRVWEKYRDADPNPPHPADHMPDTIPEEFF